MPTSTYSDTSFTSNISGSKSFNKKRHLIKNVSITASFKSFCFDIVCTGTDCFIINFFSGLISNVENIVVFSYYVFGYYIVIFTCCMGI